MLAKYKNRAAIWKLRKPIASSISFWSPQNKSEREKQDEI